MTHQLTGMRAWLVQRLSAVYMALYLLIGLVILVLYPPVDHAAWRSLVAQPVVGTASVVFIIALLLHSWIGIRDVILDYVGHYPLLRVALLGMLGFWLMALGVWAARIILMVMTP